MASVKIQEGTARGLSDLAIQIGTDPDALADQAIRDYVAWQQQEIELIRDRIRQADEAESLIPLDQVRQNLQR